MTAEQTASTLQSNELIGFELAMAREDLKCAITTGSMATHHLVSVVDGYTDALKQAFFGPLALKEVTRSSEAVEVIYAQLGCLVGKDTITIEEISEHIIKHSESVNLPEAAEYTFKDLISPFLMSA